MRHIAVGVFVFRSRVSLLKKQYSATHIVRDRQPPPPTFQCYCLRLSRFGDSERVGTFRTDPTSSTNCHHSVRRHPATQPRMFDSSSRMICLFSLDCVPSNRIQTHTILESMSTLYVHGILSAGCFGSMQIAWAECFDFQAEHTLNSSITIFADGAMRCASY